jgi:hypothetical protein
MSSHTRLDVCCGGVCTLSPVPVNQLPERDKKTWKYVYETVTLHKGFKVMCKLAYKTTF